MSTTDDNNDTPVVVEDPPARSNEQQGPTKPRQWLVDRSNGDSKIDQERLGRPWCPMCWPPPCVKWLPDLLEQNVCCEGFGNLGAFPENHDCSRIWLMRKSLVVHFCGLILSILSCLAITSDPVMLKNFAYSSGTVTGTAGGTDIQHVEFSVGLTTVLVEDAFFGQRTYALNELCTGSSLGIPLTSAEDCETCSDASAGLVATVLLGVITYLPTIASNVNRAYYNYDVNCQKVFGTLVALFSMFMSLYTWQGYANKCFGSFYDGIVTIPVLVPSGMGNDTTTTYNLENYPYADLFDGSAIANADPEDIEQNGLTIEDLYPGVNATVLAATDVRVANVNFDWKAGTGLILVVVATFLKILDIINHFLIRTPSITRSLEEQLEYEKKYGPGMEQTEDAAEGNEDEQREEVGEAIKEAEQTEEAGEAKDDGQREEAGEATKEAGDGDV